MLPLERITAMPKLYEYFGLIVMFYANEHEPVHVLGDSHEPAPHQHRCRRIGG